MSTVLAITSTYGPRFTMLYTSFEAFEGPAGTALWPTRPVSAPLHPAVLAAMADAGASGGNPSSVHRLGQRARVRVENAEACVLAFLGLAHGSFDYAADTTAATHRAVELALLARCGPRGGHVRWCGDMRRFGPSVGLLLRWRGGQVCADARGHVSWQASPCQDAPDVVVADVWDPVTGEACAPAQLDAVRPPGAHLHAIVGGYGLPHYGELWPWPHAMADSLAISSVAVGGPPGLAACVSLRPGAPLSPSGTIPRELVVGMGTAARLRAQAQPTDLPRRLAHRARIEHAAYAACGIDGPSPALGAVRCAGRIYVPGIGIANWPVDADSCAQLVPWQPPITGARAALGWICDSTDAQAQHVQFNAADRLFRAMSAQHNHEHEEESP